MSFINERFKDFSTSSNELSEEESNVFTVKLNLSILNEDENDTEAIEAIKKADPEGKILKKILDDQIKEAEEAKKFMVAPGIIEKARKSISSKIILPKIL